MHSYLSSHHPTVRWSAQLRLPDGSVVYDAVCLNETVWFMLETAEGLRNPPALRLKARRIPVREAWLTADPEDLCDHVRRKALEWLEVRSKTEPEAQLLAELRRWRERQVAGACARTRWTPEEDQRLLEAYASGASVRTLARVHGRTREAIKNRICKLAS